MQEKGPAEVKVLTAGRAEMIMAACDDLLSYGIWDGKTKVKRWVKKYVLGQQTVPQDLIFWSTGLLAVGLWHCRIELLTMQTETLLLQNIEGALAAYFERWKKKKYPLYYLDDLLAGEVFLAIYEEYDRTGNENRIIHAQNKEQYRIAIEKMAEYAFSYPTDEIGSFPYRANQKNSHIFVDSIGLTSPFLYEYGNFYGKDEGMELAVRQVANVLAYGIDAATGLPYHGYDMTTGDKYGIIGWGRAVGWLLRGMLGCMTTVYGAERLRESYSELIDATLIWQRKDGYFSWQLQAMEGPVDTSATAMICLALQEGLKTRMLQGENYREALNKGIRALQKSTKNGRIYDCLGECEGFSRYPQDYGAYPWSLGVALLLDDMTGS